MKWGESTVFRCEKANYLGFNVGNINLGGKMRVQMLNGILMKWCKTPLSDRGNDLAVSILRKFI